MREVAAAAPERWKTAPIIVEYCGGEAGSGKFAVGKAQVTGYPNLLAHGRTFRVRVGSALAARRLHPAPFSLGGAAGWCP
jgi:hypothetical protein